MTSTITNFTNSIDVNYPVAGVDNSSLGFRSNFSAIKSALDATGSEISDLQINLVGLSSTNNFGGNQIKNATLMECSIILKNYSLSELSAYTDAGSIENGTLVFVTDTYNCPAYHNDGIWYAFTGTEVSFTGEVTPSPSPPSPPPSAPPDSPPPGPTPPGPTPPGPTPPSPVWYFNGSACIYSETGTIPGPVTTYSSEAACLSANSLTPPGPTPPGPTPPGPTPPPPEPDPAAGP
jgi:hypothetical protein